MILTLALAAYALSSPSINTQGLDPGDTQDQSLAVDPQHQKDIDNDIALGKTYVAQVDKELKPTQDKRLQLRVERVGAVMAKIADAHHVKALWGDNRFSPFPYTFKVVQGSDVNAFSLPGGHIYVYEGLVNYVESDDELAGVLGHEISHAAFRHVATLQKKANKMQLLSLPLVLLGVLAGGAGGAVQALEVGNLAQTAVGNGWSREAENAADYGGFQYMTYSPYNPVGMLTVMERLARDERLQPKIDWGIYRDHPPSQERADKLTSYLQTAKIPIHRSAVASSYRAVIKPADEGSVEIWFNGIRIQQFYGEDAVARADTTANRLNNFFDQVPEVFEARISDDGNIYGRGQLLVNIDDEDAKGGNTTKENLANQTLKGIRGALFNYAYRVWDQF